MPRYTLEHFSLSEDFSEKVELHQMLLDDEKYSLDLFEYNCGYARGESEDVMSLPQNIVHARPSFMHGIRENSIALFPPCTTLTSLGEITSPNQISDFTQRQRYDEILPFADNYEYIIIPLTFKEPIFVRHPDTRIITRFDTPYTGLPSVTLALNPRFLLVHNENLVFLDQGSFLPANLVDGMLLVEWSIVPPIPFFYHGCFPEDYPNRRIRWGSHHLEEYERLHLPPSLTPDSSSPLGKRSRSESEDTDLDSEWDPDYKGPFWFSPRVKPWVRDTSEIARPRWENDKLEDYVAEPVRSFKDALAQPAAWVDVWNRYRSNRQRSESGCQFVDSNASDSHED
ncbi:hypothetical protein CPB85DRAFT_653559 [Mucidula mucida]|nr:hypothetical protein CPB85DRAFT_653559 [Mucidula mucida]